MRHVLLFAAIVLSLGRGEAQELLLNGDFNAPIHDSLGWTKYFKEPGWYGYSGEQGAGWLIQSDKTKGAFARSFIDMGPYSLLQVVAKPPVEKKFRLAFQSRYDGAIPRSGGKEATLDVRGYSETEIGILSLQLDPGEQGGRNLLGKGVHKIPVSTNWTAGSMEFVARTNDQYIAIFFRARAESLPGNKKNCFDVTRVSLMELKPKEQSEGVER